MQPLEDDVLLALAFIRQGERGGQTPDAESVEAFARSPRPQPSGDFLSHLSSLMSPWGGPPRYLAWMEDVGLVASSSSGRVRLTPLGEAMLRGAPEFESTAIVLDPDDALSYPQLVTELSNDDSVLIADPYIRLGELHQIVADTLITRVLTSQRATGSGHLQGMTALVKGADREVEVRVSTDESWHDRYVVRDVDVLQLGASINGLKKNFTALLPVTSEAVSASIRAFVEDLWSNASPILDEADGDAETAAG